MLGNKAFLFQFLSGRRALLEEGFRETMIRAESRRPELRKVPPTGSFSPIDGSNDTA